MSRDIPFASRVEVPTHENSFHGVRTHLWIEFPDSRGRLKAACRAKRQINAYLRAVPVLDKAGAYAVQEKGEWIIEALHGSLTNVVGLPVERLEAELSAWFDTAPRHP